MTTSDLLSELQGLGIRLEPQGDRLTVDAPKGVLTDVLREAIRTHKDELLELLQAPAPEAPDAAKKDPIDFEERAAIYEADGGMTRTAAEALAHHGLVVSLSACPRCNGMTYLYADGHMRCTTPWCNTEG